MSLHCFSLENMWKFLSRRKRIRSAQPYLKTAFGICILNSYTGDGSVYYGRLNVVGCSFMILGYTDKEIQLFKEMRKHGDTSK